MHVIEHQQKIITITKVFSWFWFLNSELQWLNLVHSTLVLFLITHLQKLSISPINNKKNVAWRKSLQIDVANVDDMSYRILT